MKSLKELRQFRGREPEPAVGQQPGLNQVHRFIVQFGEQISALLECGGGQEQKCDHCNRNRSQPL